MRGKFITLEGGEGAGKTTHLNLIRAYLESKQIDVVLTREPGGTPLAEKIRDLLLKIQDEKVSQETELLLMFASRAQHLSELILPALNSGRWVLCSRFTDSSYAYQGGGRGINSNKIKVLENFVQGNFQPDLTFYFDLPPELGMARAKNRGELDRIEREELNFFERVRQAYLSRAQEYPDRFRVIDASQSIQKVSEALQYYLTEFLNE